MMLRRLFSLIVISGSFCSFYADLEVIPHRAELMQCDKSYVSDVVFAVNHASRNSPYVLNVRGRLLHPWSHNVTVIFFEKFGGTFKRSFVELKFNLCDLFKEGNILNLALKRFNLKCPLRDEINLSNLTYTNFKFPYNVPFKEARAEVSFLHTDTNQILASGALYLTLKQTNRN